MKCPHCGKETDNPGRQIIAARSAAGLSQSEAARLLGVPRQKLCTWEKGRAVPRNLSELIHTLRGHR